MSGSVLYIHGMRISKDIDGFLYLDSVPQDNQFAKIAKKYPDIMLIKSQGSRSTKKIDARYQRWKSENKYIKRQTGFDLEHIAS